MDFVVNTSDHMVRCPNCNVVWEVPEGISYCICQSCDLEWCAKCCVDWHEGFTCEEFRESQQEDAEVSLLRSLGNSMESPTIQ